MSAEVSISARVPVALSQELDRLAAATQRNRSWHIEEALRRYVEEQVWQVQEIQEALDDYRSGNARLVAHEDVEARMEKLEAEIGGTIEP